MIGAKETFDKNHASESAFKKKKQVSQGAAGLL